MRRRRHLTSAATSVVVIRAFTILPQPPVLRQRRHLGSFGFLPPSWGFPPFSPPPPKLSPRRLESGSALVGKPPPQGRDGPVRGSLFFIKKKKQTWSVDRLSSYVQVIFVTDEVGRRSRRPSSRVFFPFKELFGTQKIKVMFFFPTGLFSLSSSCALGQQRGWLWPGDSSFSSRRLLPLQRPCHCP